MRKTFTLFILLCFISIFSFKPVFGQINTKDSLALVALYDSTDGSNWFHHENWLTTAPVSTWYGITVTGDRVTQVVFLTDHLDGMLPHQLGNLTALTTFIINQGNFAGGIPTEIGNLTNLVHLTLSNSITGQIPASFQNLINLNYLYLGSNFLSGTIPDFLGNLSKLQYLNLDGNNFSGPIPSSFSNLHELQELLLGANKLTGDIPSFLGDLPNLIQLSLTENYFNGVIPEELGKLSELQELDLSYNSLTGEIPVSLANLSNLAQMNLGHNMLTGKIPSSLGNLSALVTCWLNHNQLSGNIPSTIGNLSNLNELNWSDNRLTGSIPAAIGNLVNIRDLHLNDNGLSGNIPDTFLNLQLLFTLNLSNNKLTGKIPPSLNHITNLVELYLENNKLSDTIPALAGLAKLLNLDISENKLTFAGMEAVAEIFPFAIYSPQARIKLNERDNVLSASAGGTLSNNTYKWYKDGIPFRTNIGDSTLTITSNGFYTVTIKNNIATKLILHSDTVKYVTLPLSVLSFTVANDNSDIVLKWRTANEINTSYFEVQKSTDGFTYSAQGKVIAKNNLSVNNYSFVDNLSKINSTSTIFYRLKMVDLDGTYTYSATRSIDLRNEFASIIFPNPTKNYATLLFNAAGAYMITVSDNSGKIIQHITGIATAYQNSIALSLKDYPSGG